MSAQIEAREVQYASLPEQYREQMRDYIERGVRPEPFVQAVLDGNLYNAFNLSGHIPEEPYSDLAQVVGWVCGQCPVKAYGSVGAVESWIAVRGLEGKTAALRQQERDAQDYRDRMADVGGSKNANAFFRYISSIGGKS